MNRAVIERPAPAGQPVYLSTRDATSEWGDDLDVIEIWNLIWRGRLFVILGTFLACVAGLVYAFVAPEWYRAEVVLIPAKDESMQSMASQFGGLASLAGIKLGSDDTAEPLAVLASRDFAQDFLRDEGLVDVVLAAKRERFRGVKAEHLEGGRGYPRSRGIFPEADSWRLGGSQDRHRQAHHRVEESLRRGDVGEPDGRAIEPADAAARAQRGECEYCIPSLGARSDQCGRTSGYGRTTT